jgi:Ca-activated chloride channel family protein
MNRIIFWALAALNFIAGPAAACSMALVLAIDVSSSIDIGEYKFQTHGLADALLDPEIMDVLVQHQVALSVVQWSGAEEGDLTIPWRRMLSYGEVRNFSARVRDMPRAWEGSNTAVGDAIAFSAAQFDRVSDCGRKVIDVSGDGSSNAGLNAGAESRKAEAAGIEINGIAIDIIGASITAFYTRFVVTSDGFVITSRGFSDYPRSIREKLLRELIKPGS